MSRLDPEMVEEISERLILHWNYRGYTSLPEELWICGRHVCELYLKYNSLTCLPEWIDSMSNLTNIYLQANYLTELPDAIEYLYNLQTLDVSCNQLSKLPSTIGKLKKLQGMILTQNQLSSLPSSIGELHSLKTLHLNRNQMREIPYFIRTCINLEELCLDQNLLVTIPNFVTRLPNLQILSVCSNKLTSLPQLPFAAIRRFHCDNNPNLSHLPYPIACQMNRTPARPLATRNLLHISCHGCFQDPVNPNILVDNILVHFIGLPLLHNDVPTLLELTLRSIAAFVFPNPIDRTFDQRSNLHCYTSNYHKQYDELIHNFTLPLTLIKLLRDGPSAFCHGCNAFIFNGPLHPAFESKVLVQEHLNNFIQPVVCSKVFCSANCSVGSGERGNWTVRVAPN